MEIKVGDRVEVIGFVAGRDLGGKAGKVVDIKGVRCGVGVEFDVRMGGHDCNGLGKNGHCRYGEKKDFVVVGDDDLEDIIMKEINNLKEVL